MRIIKTILIILIILDYFDMKAQSPQFEWAKEISYRITSITTDNNGNIYILRNTYDWDTLLIAKYDSIGIKLWEKQVFSQNTVEGVSITVDSNKDIFIYGSFTWNAYFDSDSISVYTNNGHNPFLAKYNNDGNFLWVKNIAHASSFGAPQCVHGFQMKADNSNNIYLFGNFADTLFLIDTTILERNRSYFGKFTSSGHALWIKTLNAELTSSIFIDNSNNLIFTGYSYDTLILNTDTILNNKIFFAKVNEFGEYIWAQVIGARINQLSSSITVDLNNSIYITGNFTKVAHFGSDSLNSYGNNNLSDAFIAKYDSMGNYIWAKKIGGLSIDNSVSITTSNSNILILGYFKKTVYFDNDSLSSISNLNSDFFLASYNFEGLLSWKKHIPAFHYSADIIGHNLIAMNNHLYLTGYCSASTYLDSILIIDESYIIAKIHENNSNVEITDKPDYKVFPNPVTNELRIIIPNQNMVEGEIINIEGSIIRNFILQYEENAINTENLKDGIYLLRLSTQKSTKNIKLLKIKN